MENWIPITIAAATAQTLRFMLQKRLTGMALFQHRNFAVGITLKKTEVLLSALFGFIILGDRFTPLTVGAMIFGLVGVLLLSDPSGGVGPWHRRIFNRATALGLGAGILFGISGNGYRGAALSLAEGDAFYRAMATLACVTAFQTVTMALWLWRRETGQITRVISAWRVAGLVGLTSMIGSMCWFTAFALQNAAYVNAVGQIELLFSLLIGAFVFGERISAREWQGLTLLTGSIVALVLAL